MSMAEIAKRAGVSTATVCRVVQASPLVREETAVHVRKVMEEIGYVPPPPRARGKRRRGGGERAGLRQGRIAVITLGQPYRNWLSVPMIGSFVAEVTSAAHEFDVHVMLDEMPEVAEPCRAVQRGEVGGAILLIDSAVANSPAGLAAMAALRDRLPVVWAMGGHLSPAPIDHVAPDNLAVGYLAASYLAQRGCKRAAFVTSSPRWALTRVRAMGFAAAADDLGLETYSCLVSDSPRDGRVYPGRVEVVPTLSAAAEQLSANGVRPDGVFVARDFECAQFYPLLAKAGLRPQREVQMVSCDNDASQLALMEARPATIDLDTREIARRAIARLLRRMQNTQEPPVLVGVQPRLVEPPGVPVG